MLMGGNGSIRNYLVRAVDENRPWDRIFHELLLPNQADEAGKVAAEYLRAAGEGHRPAHRRSQLDILRCQHQLCPVPRPPAGGRLEAGPLLWDEGVPGADGPERQRQEGAWRNAGSAPRGSRPPRARSAQARMMFLTGRKATESEASRDATAEEQKLDKERLQKGRKDKAPPPPPRFSARAKLVEMALAPEDRDYFARAIVNRVWARLLGRGLVMPMDQMHSANPPSHPELLAWLARDTIAHGYDLRRLIRGLVLSRAYARESRWAGETPPRPSLFAVAAVRPLSPSQLACSLRLATADPETLPASLNSGELDTRVEATATAPAADRRLRTRPTARSAWPRRSSSATASKSIRTSSPTATAVSSHASRKSPRRPSRSRSPSATSSAAARRRRTAIAPRLRRTTDRSAG